MPRPASRAAEPGGTAQGDGQNAGQNASQNVGQSVDQSILARATGTRLWADHGLLLWAHFLVPPVLAALVVAATFATPGLAGILAGAVLAIAAVSARGLLSRLSQAEEARLTLNSQLIQSQKLAAIGELSAGLAHEINNPIAIIAQEAEWAAHLVGEAEKTCTADFAEIKDSLREIRSQVDRCKNITHKLLDFARRREPVLQEVDVARLIDDMARLVDKEASYKNVTLVRSLPPNLPLLRTDAPLLRQVVLNLMTNALQAVAEGGRIEVAARMADETMEIIITDNGCGIPPENLDKIFNPFFTTKPPGQGTGLGLSMCHTLVGGMNGQICVESQPGQGATFTVRLPRQP